MSMNAFLAAYIALLTLTWLGLMALATISMAGNERNAPSRRKYMPKTLVMVPCKGIDITLSGNLASLANQSYRNYDVVAIVDDLSDPAVGAIRDAGIRLIRSSHWSGYASGKVRAIATAFTKFKDYEVYVVADSDVTVSRDWLAKLVGPLADGSVGVSTAFPYFRPVGGFWSKVKLVWGFVGNGMMESKITRFAWGGSMAFRKGLLDEISFREFAASVSDDIPITRIAKRKGLEIKYVPERIVEVKSNDSFAEFKEWSNRQSALTILGNRKNFRYGVVLYSANILLLLSSILMAIIISPLFAVLLLPFVIGAVRMYMRAGVADPELFVAYLMVNFIYLANLIVANRMKYITWRGAKYHLK